MAADQINSSNLIQVHRQLHDGFRQPLEQPVVCGAGWRDQPDRSERPMLRGLVQWRSGCRHPLELSAQQRRPVRSGSRRSARSRREAALAPISREPPLARRCASFQVTVPQGYGTINQVKPEFASLALQDEWRPSDRWDINLGVRFESYVYDLPSANTPENNF